MPFMVVERFRDNDMVPIHERIRDSGRILPDGLNNPNLLPNSHLMKPHPTLHRIKFRDVSVGQRFYDPISAEYFVKQTATMAAMVTGAGDGTVADEFEIDDVVGVEQP